jgi:hypothetical protein
MVLVPLLDVMRSVPILGYLSALTSSNDMIGLSESGAFRERFGGRDFSSLRCAA